MNAIQSIIKANKKKRVDEAKHGKDIKRPEPSGKSVHQSIVDKAVKNYKSKTVGKEHAKQTFWGKDC